MRIRGASGSIAALGMAALLAACSSGAGGGDSAATTPAAESGPVTLQFWCWGSGQKDKVAAFNKAHPDIQVQHTDVGGGTDTAAKLLTAGRAGNGPDAACLEYESLPAMIVAGALADISAHTGPIKDAFSPDVWTLTSFDGAVYGVPQDLGPMVFVYNRKRFDELKIEVPVTWQDFADVAAQVRKKDPEAYLATFAPAEFGNFAGLAQQAGASWWKVQGTTWSVGIADAPSLEVAGFWQGLIDKDLIKAQPLLTPEWNNQLNKGKILSWPSALWAPGVLYGIAEKQAGDWAIAPLPQWTAGDARVAFQGGSALAVTKNSKHVQAAATFAAWMNTDKTANDLQIAAGEYPASLAGQRATSTSEPPKLVGGQKDYWQVAAKAAQNTIPHISWGPNVGTASSAYQDAVAAAVRDKTPLADALKKTQQVVVDDMKATGFQVAGS
ncbi:carbohydrate ABC transporter substrate-binding protein (CUT1 family) [Nonomuraea fuscirosea]|uniref:Carbohydrate ABC transporter substrate-binding protein (CUT1 family) n=1 Tax=Nonomuraea fuscirosea TaxID=1291556 RepID=A0A2T0N500_9ACTN|nr:extracellular solute-binding protein [Nonomuraea fuscirosea]PRX67425.1 carbohydrate ABC transporter substrate-binding protein (CUT1 family) [Nonomuraea fuscirosea]